MSDETAPLSAVRVEPVVMPLTDGELRIIYEHGLPYGIRDRRGFMFFFTKVQKYSNQEERYRQEVEHKFRVADFLLKSLQGHNYNSTAQMPGCNPAFGPDKKLDVNKIRILTIFITSLLTDDWRLYDKDIAFCPATFPQLGSA